MALNSILEITNQACDELGIARPGASGLVASSIPQDRQLLGLLHAACGDLLRDHDWSSLYATASIAISSAAGASYSLPADFERVVEDTGWDRTNNFPMTGNISIQRHQYRLSALVLAPITRKEYRLFVGNNSGTLYIHPPPTASEDINFLYIKRYWATDLNGATPADRFVADTDLTLFKPELLVKELKWRFRSAKGLDATALKIECDNFKDLMLARDVATGALDMTGRGQLSPLDFVNIPDGSWNIP